MRNETIFPNAASVGEALSQYTSLLEAEGVPEADISVQHIVAHVMQTHRVIIHYTGSVIHIAPKVSDKH